jgi:RNA polymerase sigma-70 factor
MRQDPENWTGKPVEGDSLSDCKYLTDRLYVQAGAGTWGLTKESFAVGLRASAGKHFGEKPVSGAKLEDYFGTLHLKDLALACACRDGHEGAWEYFVATYRNHLRRAAAAILRSSETSPNACELADSLFGKLYGLRENRGPGRSLFRYFHGRSSLKTWLRTVLAQCHVDAIRSGRRFTELDESEQEPRTASLQANVNGASQHAIDPHRQRYVALFTRTLEVALGLLDTRDKERLRMYYAEELTLAEIGKRLGEHESSVSRNLERTRRELRGEVEQVLRKGRVAGNGLAAETGLSDEEIALCFEYGAQEAPIDFEKLFRRPTKRTESAETQPS